MFESQNSVSSLNRNIIANFAGKGISALSVYLFVPIYADLLGIENYGVIGFYALLQGVFAIANFGLTATLTREIARLSVETASERKMRDMLRTLELIFWGLALLVMIVVACLAGSLAQNWINVESLNAESVAGTIRIMGACIAFQIASNLYLGGIAGLQRQVLSNCMTSAAALARGGGAVLVLWFVSATVDAFFVWQLIVNITFALLNGLVLWRCLPRCKPRPMFRYCIVRSVWRYSAGMAGLTLISVALTETDKIILSKYLSLEAFGYYALVAVLSQVPIMLSRPISVAVFPRLTQLVELGEAIKLDAFYHNSCQLVSVISIPSALLLAAFSYELIYLWTGNATAADSSYLIATILSLGSLCLSLSLIPYCLVLAHGFTRLNLTVGLTCILFYVPAVAMLTKEFGGTGAACAWLLLNLFSLLIYVPAIDWQLTKRLMFRWCHQDVGLPLIASLSPVLFMRTVVSVSQFPPFLVATLLGFIWLLSVSLAISVSSGLRSSALRVLSRPS